MANQNWKLETLFKIEIAPLVSYYMFVVPEWQKPNSENAKER